MKASSIGWLLLGQQGYAELRAALEPWAWTVARLLEKVMHIFEHLENPRRAEGVAEAERPARIAQAEHHRALEVLGRADAHLHDVAADIDDVRHHALRHEARRVADDRDRNAVRGEQGVRRVAHLGLRHGRRHERAALGEAE